MPESRAQVEEILAPHLQGQPRGLLHPPRDRTHNLRDPPPAKAEFRTPGRDHVRLQRVHIPAESPHLDVPGHNPSTQPKQQDRHLLRLA